MAPTTYRSKPPKWLLSLSREMQTSIGYQLLVSDIAAEMLRVHASETDKPMTSSRRSALSHIRAIANQLIFVGAHISIHHRYGLIDFCATAPAASRYSAPEAHGAERASPKIRDCKTASSQSAPKSRAY
jgi:hypothetical protein